MTSDTEIRRHLRIPEPYSIEDERTRSYLNELVRSLRELERFDKEAVEDTVAALVCAGTNMTIDYDDPAGVLTFNASTGGGGLTTAEACAIVEGYGFLTSALTTAQVSSYGYLTSANTDGIYMTTAETCALVESYGYISAGGVGGITTAEACALVESYDYITSQEASSTYQPIGAYLTSALTTAQVSSYNYLTSANTDGVYLTTAEADALYQAVGDYITSQTASATYQPIGNYLTSALTTAQVSSYGYLTSANTDGVYLTTAEGDTLYQPAGSYLTSALTTAQVSSYGYLTSANTDGIYLTTAEGDARYTTTAEVSQIVSAGAGGGGFTPLMFQVQNNTGRTIGTASATITDWDTPDKVDSIFSFASGTGQLTINDVGWFSFNGKLRAFQGDSNNRIQLELGLKANGNTIEVDQNYAMRNNTQDRGTAQFSNFLYQVTATGQIFSLYEDRIGASCEAVNTRFTVVKLGD